MSVIAFSRWLAKKLVRLIFRQHIICLRNSGNMPFYFRPSEYPSLLKRVWRSDPDIQRQWSKLLHPNEVVFDVGANIGSTVQMEFSLLGGCCDIYAFEPVPRNFELLRMNTDVLKSNRIHLVLCALGDREGEITLLDNLEHGALSAVASFRGTHMQYGSKVYWRSCREITAKLTTLDAFTREHPDIQPTFVKVDVEGAGAMVVAGAQEMLKRTWPCIYCEFHSPEEKDGILEVLGKAGYRPLVLHRDGSVLWESAGKNEAYFLHPSDPRFATFERVKTWRDL